MKKYVVTIFRLLIAHFTRHACNALSFVQRWSNSTTSTPAALYREQKGTQQRRHLPPFDGSSFNVVSAFTFLRTDKRASPSNLPFRRSYIFISSTLYTTGAPFLSSTTDHVNSIKRNDNNNLIIYARNISFFILYPFVYFFSFNRHIHPLTRYYYNIKLQLRNVTL